jgi:hypothetical protein
MTQIEITWERIYRFANRFQILISKAYVISRRKKSPPKSAKIIPPSKFGHAAIKTHPQR